MIVKSIGIDKCNKCGNKKISGHFIRCVECNYNICRKCAGIKGGRKTRLRPSNKNVVGKKPENEKEEEEDDDCCICMMPLIYDKHPGLPKCKHSIFHKRCINKYL